MKKSELRALIRECVCDALKEASYNSSDDEFIEDWISMELGDEVGDAIIDQTIENVKEEWKEAARNYPNVRSYLMDLRKNGGLEGLGESKINEEITLNSPSFKKLVTKIQEISDKSGNDWDALKAYLKGKYPMFDTYTTGTNPAAYVVNFFAITKGKDEWVKKKPQDYVQVGEWYVRPW